MSKNEFMPETRETLRQYVINNRETYEAITAQARQLAGIVAETAAKVNAFSVEETGAPVVNTPADLAALISVVLAETDEVLTWELINKHTAKG